LHTRGSIKASDALRACAKPSSGQKLQGTNLQSATGARQLLYGKTICEASYSMINK